MGAADLHPHHPVALRGPLSQRPGAPALLADVEAEDFVAALAAGLKQTAWPRFGWPATLPFAQVAALGAPRALYQPIHRRFNLVLLDTHCEVFGTPRLDPRKIESSGFVVRRWVGPAVKGQPDAPTLNQPAHWQAWQEVDGLPVGWRGFADARQFDADPDPTRRALPRTGNAAVDLALAARQVAQAAEAVQRLYPLPPDVAEHARRTLLYGLVPTSEARHTVRAAAVDYTAVHAPGADRDDYLAHLSPYLRRTGSARVLPDARGTFHEGWLQDEKVLDPDQDVSDPSLLHAQFTAFVRQLALEFDVGGSRGEALLVLLNEIPIVWIDKLPLLTLRREEGAANFLRGCARVVRENAAPPIEIPDEFGPVPEGWLERFTDATLAVVQARSAEARTLEGRADDEQALYAIRAFVRVKGEAGCPPRLVWSEMTPLYRVAPWYASTGAPQARIALPALDAASLRAMKPNVAFDLPPSLASLLARNSPKQLLGGGAKAGSDVGIGWLCSFSIPIITICAFIALNVILSLLDFVFRWMPFVKICLPVPRRK